MPTTPALLWTSLSLSLILPALGWIGFADLSWGVFLYTPLTLVPHHALLLARGFGPLTRLVLHALLVVYAAGTSFASFGAALVFVNGRNECTHAYLACHWWARLAVLALLQAVCGAAEAIALSAIVWRTRAEAPGDAEGAIQLPEDAPQEWRGWWAPTGMPTSIQDVQVCAVIYALMLRRLIESVQLLTTDQPRGGDVRSSPWSNTCGTPAPEPDVQPPPYSR
jgi:hypothetical protein